MRIAMLARSLALAASLTGPPVADLGAATTATATATATATGNGARQVQIKTDHYQFDYAYPAAAGAIPGLRAFLDKDIATRSASLSQGADDDAAGAATDHRAFNPWSATLDWKIVTDLPRWLSLSAIVGGYTGGAHPNYTYGTLLWDRQAGRRRLPLDLFASKAALSAALTPAFCAELDRQRAAKRGNNAIDPGTGFNDCLNPVGETLVLGSASHRAFDRIGIICAPYEAGPYVEGTYEVTLPVTPAVLAAVRPEYRASFALSQLRAGRATSDR